MIEIYWSYKRYLKSESIKILQDAFLFEGILHFIKKNVLDTLF